MGKWLSVLNHIINIHTGHGDLFPTCQHGTLEGRERHKKWLKAGISFSKHSFLFGQFFYILLFRNHTANEIDKSSYSGKLQSFFIWCHSDIQDGHNCILW